MCIHRILIREGISIAWWFGMFSSCVLYVCWILEIWVCPSIYVSELPRACVVWANWSFGEVRSSVKGFIRQFSLRFNCYVIVQLEVFRRKLMQSLQEEDESSVSNSTSKDSLLEWCFEQFWLAKSCFPYRPLGVLQSLRGQHCQVFFSCSCSLSWAHLNFICIVHLWSRLNIQCTIRSCHPFSSLSDAYAACYCLWW